MKILFWIFAVMSIVAGLFVSFLCYLSHGLDLSGTVIGEVVCIVGMLALVVCIVCMVLGIRRLRKGDVKKAVVFALAGVVYSGIILAGVYVDDAVHTALMDKSIADNKDAMYGENWDSAPAIADIPEF